MPFVFPESWSFKVGFLSNLAGESYQVNKKLQLLFKNMKKLRKHHKKLHCQQRQWSEMMQYHDCIDT